MSLCQDIQSCHPESVNLGVQYLCTFGSAEAIAVIVNLANSKHSVSQEKRSHVHKLACYASQVSRVIVKLGSRDWSPAPAAKMVSGGIPERVGAAIFVVSHALTSRSA